MNETIRTGYYLIGVTDEGDKIAVEGRLYRKDGTHFDTIEHEPVGGTYSELSLSGASRRKGRSVRNPNGSDAYGQIYDSLPRIVKTYGSVTAGDVMRLVTLWKRWHLNGLKAGCAHMTLPRDPSYDARKDITCPETGYRYGQAWLVDLLPASVWDEIMFLISCGEYLPNV